MRILIAEDDLTSRNILKLFLSKQGHEVVATVDGAEAWLSMQHPDAPKLAILDWVMPTIDGIEVCRRIRTLKTDQPTYVIMLTTKAKKADIVSGLEAGADDYMTKPFDYDELRARVNVGIRIIENEAKLLEARKKIDEALKAAGRIQHSLLPTHLPVFRQVEFAWKFAPCDAVGGDIFNIVPLDANHIGMYMLDVAGHGPPSAMISVLVYQLMNSHTGVLVDHTVNPPAIRDPEAVLNILDREFPLLRFRRHFTIIYAVLDLASSSLTYSNAAHCTPIILPRENDLKILTTSGTVIGLNAIPFGQETVAIAPGDKVVIFSDGVIEMENAAHEFFGEERLYQVLRANRTVPPADMVHALYTEAMSYAGAQPVADDVSIMACEYKG
jgi:sigma-B regulation protein RsbU (phosphoserine phosphatase)